MGQHNRTLTSCWRTKSQHYGKTTETFGESPNVETIKPEGLKTCEMMGNDFSDALCCPAYRSRSGPVKYG